MSARIDQDLLELVQAQAERWADRLIDLGPRNALLHFKNTKTASLDLTSADESTLRGLLTGSSTRLSSLFTDSTAHKDACARVRNLRRRMVAFEEEQGVEVGKIAHGLVRTTNTQVKGTGPIPSLRAPLLLRSVRIEPRTVSENDFSLAVENDVEINPVLLHALDQVYGLDVDREQFIATVEELTQSDDPAEQMQCIHATLADLAAAQGLSLELDNSVVIGLFNYEKLPMVNDLRAAGSLLAQHELVSALAGHEPSANSVRTEGTGFSPSPPDSVRPADEYLVQDADSSQQKAINTALSGHHVLIEGPPGTGKSQTIANIIAGAAALGKRVLFVAEKRAAIEAVADRLDQVGLKDLVFDLHQQKVDKKQIAKQLQESLEATSRQQPVKADDLHQRLEQRRRSVRAASDALHKPREPWDIRAYDVQNELLTLTEYETRHAFRGPALHRLDAQTVRDLEKKLRDFVDAGGFRVLRKESPWWQADIRTTEDIEEILPKLDALTSETLQTSQTGMHRLLRQTGLKPPDDLTGWNEVLNLLDGVHSSVAAFGADVFGTQLDDWYCATANRAQRAQLGSTLSWLQRRALFRQVKAASTDGITKKPALHRKLSAVVQQRDRWREMGGVQPAEVVGLPETMNAFQTMRDQLASVAMCAKLPEVERSPTQQVHQQLHDLAADKDTMWRMPTITDLKEEFHALGLTPLIEDAATRKLTGEQLWLTFRSAWLRSLLDEFKLKVPVLRDFRAEQQTRLVSEFRTADLEHRVTSARRVRWAVASRLRQVRDDFPDETRLLKDQASKKSRHLPVRRLVERASHVLLALRPCWAMSPLVVSKTLPAEQLFDIVIFDEASQIQPHDAITSIARGRKLVVAGDDQQLPPTNFFGKLLEGSDDDIDEGENSELEDYESILTAMRSLIPRQETLRWHYRSRDERLIAFSNRHVYQDQLVTFPGAHQDPPVTLDVVDGVASPGQDGSSPAEIQRVVERVLEHAEHRAHESLGVITMGQKHMDRVDAAVRKALQDRPDLAEFFSEDAGPGKRFFVKNLERVQGDERDAIILTVGVAKRANGTVARTGFGPLNNEGGRRRLNVAVTRAKRRMLVVSSFSAHDLAPTPEVTGTELLRRYLEFAQNGADVDNVGEQEDFELNGFEEDIRRALSERGIDAHPQWGFSGYRIDFALAHRDQPGRMVLAVEADGDTYHRALSVRDRDRLRQAHLENLGWRFHRVWSSSWFADPTGEAERIAEAWEQAMIDADRELPAVVPEPEDPTPQPHVERGPRPSVLAGLKTNDYTDADLIAICRWLTTDQLPLDREERINQALKELGFRRRGSRIVARLTRAVDIARSQMDEES
ncbi:AAA domain-containing protein [Saccharopolyspora sp. NPDC002686]|uniref:AAA domain-containing protein n=1 Tax=Saccharopolyspora sp. NPDC002686 TaxID=3154541 RepID=UPI00332C5A63